eukprot:2498596-Rhodomonas_salina.1
MGGVEWREEDRIPRAGDDHLPVNTISHPCFNDLSSVNTGTCAVRVVGHSAGQAVRSLDQWVLCVLAAPHLASKHRARERKHTQERQKHKHKERK